MTPISSITSPIAAPSVNITPPVAPAAGDAAPFRNLLLEGLDQVNSMQQEANAAVEQLVTGGDLNPAEVLTTL